MAKSTVGAFWPLVPPPTSLHPTEALLRRSLTEKEGTCHHVRFTHTHTHAHTHTCAHRVRERETERKTESKACTNGCLHASIRVIVCKYAHMQTNTPMNKYT